MMEREVSAREVTAGKAHPQEISDFRQPLMETLTEPKPKRKYVMTPERRAKLMENLAQARLAPKEKVYRKTPKRYAANLNNLGIASAKRRQEAETLRAKMEGLFPPPEVPPLPIPPPLTPPHLRPSPPTTGPPTAGDADFDEATRLIGKRLRKVQATVRREGRRIMRLLTAAINRSQPLTVEEAIDLAGRLLKCLDGSRVTAEAHRLNKKIARLLSKMIETRYGAEAQAGGFPLETALEQLREMRRQRAAERRARRAARQAQGAQEAEKVRKGHSVTPGDPAEARPGAQVGVGPAVVAEGGNENAGSWGGQLNEPRRVSVPELPEKWEDFQSLLTRALDLEEVPEVAGALAENLWNRLHLWKVREETESKELEELFQKGAANPADSYPDPYHELRDRAYIIPLILKLDDDFLRWMDQLTARVERCLDWWVTSIPSIERRRASRPAAFPAKPPVRVTSGQPASGSEDLSSVA
jgi:hypothetical protein